MKKAREYFDEQAKALGIQCELRRALREAERKDKKRRAEKLARRIIASGAHEVDLLEYYEKERIRQMDKDGVSVNDIAMELGTDLITVAAVIDGVAL